MLARAGSVVPVRGDDGGLELEVWAPAAGRTGGGTVVRDAGDGWDGAKVERFVTRVINGRVVVERADGGATPRSGTRSGCGGWCAESGCPRLVAVPDAGCRTPGGVR